jgi:acetyl esterase/lipase
MASIQSHFAKFGIRRLSIFSSEKTDPQRLRARAEGAARFARAHRGVRVVEVAAGSAHSEWLIPDSAPQDRALLYIHGGAWFLGSARTYRGFVSGLAYTSRTRALTIDYRLAPENPFPAGLDDCVSAYEWLLQSGISADKIVVAGDSAGGNLTLALLVALRDAGRPLPAGAVTLSPATDLAGTGESRQTRRHLDPYFYNMSPKSTIIPDYITNHDARNPLISPLYADLHGLPPLLMHVGDHEILLDDTLLFYDRACAAGVKVKLVVWPGMFHVFQMFAPFLPEAREANKQIAEFIGSRLNR